MRLERPDQFLGPRLGRRQPVKSDHHAHADGVEAGVEEAAAGDPAGAADHLDVQALVTGQPEPLFYHLARQREGLLDSQRGVRRVGARQQPGLLGQEGVHSVAGDHDPGVNVAARPVGAHAGDPAGRIPQQAGGHRRSHQLGTRRDRLTGQPGVEIGAIGRHPVVRRAIPGVAAVVDGQRLGRRHQHGGPPGHPALYRRLRPPPRHDLVQDPPVHHAAVDVLRAGEDPALYQHHVPAGPGQLERRRRTRGPGTDDHGVDGRHVIRHGSPPSPGSPAPPEPSA